MAKYDDEKPNFGEKILAAFFYCIDGCGSLLRKLVWPIEALFAAIGSFINRRLDKSTDEDSWSYRFWSALGKPFFAVVDFFLRKIDSGNDEDSVLFKIRNAVYWPFIKFGAGVAWILRQLNLDTRLAWIFGWVAFLSWPIVYPVRAGFNFLAAFYYSRSKRLLWYTLPMVLLIGGLGYLVFRVQQQDVPEIGQRYRRALDTAIENENFQAAALYREKLRQLGQQTDQFELRQADLLLNRGKVDEAFASVDRLSPQNTAGLPAGHFWLAVHYLNDTEGYLQLLGVSTEEATKRAMDHLDRLGEVGFRGVEVDLMRAAAMMNQGKRIDAQQLLTSYRDQTLPAALMRFQLDLQLSDLANAKEDALAMTDLLRRQRDFSNQKDKNLYKLWLAAEQLLARPVEIEKVATLWHRQMPEDQEATTSLAIVRLARFADRWKVASRVENDELVTLLISAAELLPTEKSPQLTQTMMEMQAMSERNPRVAELYQQVATDPRLPGVLLEFFGTYAASRGDFAKARDYLVKTVEKSPKFQVAWNNYAFVIENGFPDEMGLALEAVNKAVELDPSDVHARDTRSSILMKTGQWKQAIDDLKIVSNGQSVSKAVHESLAKAYREIGNEALAKTHERLAQNAVR